jgi:hypothetical protein
MSQGSAKPPSDSARAGDNVNRMVLVGRRFGSLAPSWNDWTEKHDFDAALAEIAERQREDKATMPPSEVLEVIVVRRAFVRTDITIDEEPIQ